MVHHEHDYNLHVMHLVFQKILAILDEMSKTLCKLLIDYLANRLVFLLLHNVLKLVQVVDPYCKILLATVALLVTVNLQISPCKLEV